MTTRSPVPGLADVPHSVAASVPQAGKYRDLCSTCNHVKACGGRSTPERPIFFCEQFDTFVPVPVQKAPRVSPARPKKRRAANRRKGLCTTCENAEGCSLPASDGGVWHCEEYR